MNGKQSGFGMKSKDLCFVEGDNLVIVYHRDENYVSFHKENGDYVAKRKNKLNVSDHQELGYKGKEKEMKNMIGFDSIQGDRFEYGKLWLNEDYRYIFALTIPVSIATSSEKQIDKNNIFTVIC